MFMINSARAARQAFTLIELLERADTTEAIGLNRRASALLDQLEFH
jgi:hypothetical protein